MADVNLLAFNAAILRQAERGVVPTAITFAPYAGWED